jgi:hypothetical protein
MSGPWEDGRRAWERLDGWDQAPPADGDGALAALTDIGTLRRLLDQAELVAVRTARRQGRSWTEIATKLGITRQSAWERWRDLDEVGGAGEVGSGGAGEVGSGGAGEVIGRTAEHLVVQAARERRRRSSVVVPHVVGLSWEEARRVLERARLVAVGPDPDGPPLGAEEPPDGIVTDQSPESGAKVPAGSPVILWVQRDGGSGVREPRRPRPRPKSGRAFRPDVSDEAVG